MPTPPRASPCGTWGRGRRGGRECSGVQVFGGWGGAGIVVQGALWAVVLRELRIGQLPSQATVRVQSSDGRVYLGVVVRGPFALPDGLRADAPPVVASAVRGGFFLPEYHGLVIVEIAGEERNGQLQPHRFRPLPN